MKNLNKIGKIAVLAIGLLSLNSCKDYFDLTDNPNLVQDPPLNSLLTTATHKAAFNNYRIAYFNNYYTQYFASPSAGSDTDTYQTTNNSTSWDNLYYAMADLNDYMKFAQESGSNHHVGIAELLMSYQLSLVADTWGSAPYSKAFSNEPGLTVAYDSEEELYKSQIELIDKALANFDKEAGTITIDPRKDLLNNGKIERWKKFAHGLKARVLNKVSKKASYNREAVLSEVAKSLTKNAEDVGMNVFDGSNPWFNIARGNLNQDLDGWLSSNFVDQLNGKTYGLIDPRVAYITEKTVDNVYKGTRNGEGNVGGANTRLDECYISMKSTVSSDTSSLGIISFAEIKFIEAEAAFRKNDKQTAYNAYLDGTKANMLKLAVPTNEIEVYIEAISKGPNNLTLLDIFREKYIVTYLNAEAWNDARRFDYKYKNFQLPVGAVLGDKFIRRVAYPLNERTENGSNVPAEVPLSTELWWDKP